MNYMYYLKKQLFYFALICIMAILITLRDGRWSFLCSLPQQFLMILSVTYVFGGAYIRFLMNENIYDEYDMFNDE